MNEKFFSLPKEKQQAILNAGYRVFSQNTYKNSPMSEIAEAANISKSLLFHYFVNKKELYLYLWDQCAEITLEYMNKYNCYEQTDLFESMLLGMKVKMEIMRLYPDMANFTIKAFYEKDPEVQPSIQASSQKYIAITTEQAKLTMDPKQFREGIDLSMMYREMYLAMEGYLWEMNQQGTLNIDGIEKNFTALMNFWKSIYLRKDES